VNNFSGACQNKEKTASTSSNDNVKQRKKMLQRSVKFGSNMQQLLQSNHFFRGSLRQTPPLPFKQQPAFRDKRTEF